MQTEHKRERIAVTGATGRVGAPLVEILALRGHDVVGPSSWIADELAADLLRSSGEQAKVLRAIARGLSEVRG
jgi:nucleoside-diphosphate-sugar epimerase